MKWIKSLCLVAICAGIGLASSVEARPMTIDDALSVKRPRQLALAPTANKIAYTISHSIWVTTSSKNTQIITSGNSPVWGKSGTLYFYRPSKPNQIFAINALKKDASIATFSLGIKSFILSPDEKKIAAIVQTPPRHSLVIYDRETNSYHNYSPANHHVLSISWSPSSNAIVYSALTEKITSDNLDAKGFIIPLKTAVPKPLLAAPVPFLRPSWQTASVITFATTPLAAGQWRGSLMLGVYNPLKKSAVTFFHTKKQSIEKVYGYNESEDALLYLVEEKVSYHLYKLPLKTGLPVALTTGTDIWEEFCFSKQDKQTFFIKENGNLPPEIYSSSFPHIKPVQLTTLNITLKQLDLGKTDIIQWKNKDKETIEGILIKPVGFSSGKTYPLITILHGGPASSFSNRFANGTWSYPTQVLAGMGFAILMPNPRGSTGYGKPFQSALIKKWGIVDYDDVMTGIDYVVKTLKIADQKRLGVAGWSYGGYLSTVMLAKSSQFKAASIGAGFSDLFSLYATIDIPDWMESYLGETPFDDPSLFLERSPIYKINTIKTPTLIQHGALDTRVPVTQARLLNKALSNKGVTVSYQEFPNEGHVISRYENKKACMEENVKWFNKYLK